jgi:hypothetical protein
LVSRQDLSNVTTRIFVQLLIISKDYDRDIDRAENGKLMRLLEQATFALEERSVGKGTDQRGFSEDFATRLMTYTERFLSSLMALISIFLLPIAATRRACGR